MTDLIVDAEGSPDDCVGLMRAMCVGLVVQKDKELQATKVINADQHTQLEAKDAALLLKDAEVEDKDKTIAAFKMKLADFKTKLTAAEEEKAAAEKAKTVAEKAKTVAEKGRTAAETGYNKKKAECQSLEKKLEGQLEAFAEGKKITRDNMKKRNEKELERYAEGAELRIKQAVASAVEEKDEVIEDLKRDNKLLRDYRRKSEGSTISNLPSA